MNPWLASFTVAVASGTLGLFGAGVLGSACVRWHRISGFEGGSGFFVIYLALGGGLLGGIAGLAIARSLVENGNLPFVRALETAAATVAGLLVLGAVVARLTADVPPEVDGSPVRLDVEFRLPVGADPPSKDTGPRLHLGSVVGGRQRATCSGALRPADARIEAGRWILPGWVVLFTRRGQATISVTPPLGEPTGFLVPLPSDPADALDRWSDWLPRPRPEDPPWPDDRLSYRFRLRAGGGEAD